MTLTLPPGTSGLFGHTSQPCAFSESVRGLATAALSSLAWLMNTSAIGMVQGERAHHTLARATAPR